MKTKGKLVRYVSVLLVVILFSIQSAPLYAASMEDYCIVPPYVKKEIPPNIMILMDNSKDMLKSAYLKPDSTYVPGGSYEGYFENTKYYEYKASRFEISAKINPNPGAYTQATLVVSGAILFKGALLNWATTSRFDLLQKVLIGGKATSRQTHDNTLESESDHWKKTYSDCSFEVSGGELTIKDDHGGSCSLLDTPPTAIALNARPPAFASNSPSIGSYLTYLLEFLIKDAYAAKPVKITKGKLPDGEVGKSYSTTLDAADGTTPYTWSIASGSLPLGLSLNSTTGEISGTPNTDPGCASYPCAYSFIVEVTDATGGTDTKDLDIKIKPSTQRSLGPMKVRIDTGGVEQKGIVHEYLGYARWGLTTYRKDKAPYVEKEIEERTTDAEIASFVTAIENIGIQKKAPLGKAYYGILNYFKHTKKGDAWDGSPGRDPFDGDATPCRNTFVLTISSVKNVKGKKDTDLSDKACFAKEDIVYICKKGHVHKINADDQPLITHSCYGYKNDLRADKDGEQNVYHYGVFTFGDPDDGTDTDEYETNPGCLDPTDPTYDPLLCEAEDSPRAKNKRILKAATQAGGGMQEGKLQFYDAGDTNLRDALTAAITDIITRAAAGTAASVLASGEGSGANLIQAVFYPRTPQIPLGIFDRNIGWIGRLTNYWYYVDPFFIASSVLDDSGSDPSDKVLNLSNDKAIRLRFDTSAGFTMADRYSFGSATLLDTIPFENVKSLWEAGLELWERTSERTIKTTIGSGLIDFSVSNADALRQYLQADDVTEASNIIRYIQGEELSGYRSRTVAVDLNGDGDTADAGESAKVWKLSDVLNSTPKISSWIPLNNYHQVHSDVSYGNGTSSGFINTAGYKSRGMVFAGGNDGMLHAFKLGKLELAWSSPTQTASQIARITGSDLGKEIWAYIPKNALPYLKYIKEADYCHVYTIDLSPYIFDASIGASGSGDISNDTKPDDGSTWRTILIGGMRFGGACKNTCATTDCVQTPVTNLGYSSYFALDITDQSNPTLLWEFSDENLGFTTTGPTIVRIGDKAKNGKWFVVFGSGPTGPISASDHQFLGRSNQNLRLFVLDLKTGAQARTPIDTGIGNAFAGSMLNSTMDIDLDYQDDAVYIGYVKKCTNLLHPCTSDTWTDGGVGRLLTKESTDPSKWVWSQVMDGIGPVTSSIAKLLNKNKGILWLFFGTGRYYFEQLSTVDDGTNRRTLFGIKEPCYETTGFKSVCTSSPPSPPSVGSLTDVTDIADAEPASITNGWELDLDAQGNYTYYEGGAQITRNCMAERVITDPVATTSGLVFFTTYKPYTDVCAHGGKSFIWAVKYSTGGAAGALLKGMALLQVSTGSIEQVNLSSAFTEAGGRKTSALEGVPPTAQGLAILSTPPPVKRAVHMRER